MLETNKTIKLSSNELKSVSGGAWWYAGKHAVDKKHPYELIDDKTGKTLASFSTEKQVKYEARLLGLSTTRYIFWSTILKKRDAFKQHELMSVHVRSNDNVEWVNPF